MPGYGRSTSRKGHSEYSEEEIVQGMLAVLADTSRDEAIWIGHDWGPGAVCSLANLHPEACRATTALCPPYHKLELGLEELLKSVNRGIYPEDEYPYGQWSYIVCYEQSFDQATSWFEKGSKGVLKALFKRGQPEVFGKPLTMTADVLKDGRRLGGGPNPPSTDRVPDGNDAIDSETFQELVAAFEKSGWFGTDSWYMHSRDNREFNLTRSSNNGRLDMP